MLAVPAVDWACLPDHRKYPHCHAHESWMASEAKNIWEKYNMPLYTIILHYQDVMIQTQMYNMTLLPILH
jgi:hypothetical protein